MTATQEIVPFTIDGQKVSAPRGSELLPAALKHGFDIPNLCYHPAVRSYGACRLCLVEVKRKGRTRLTTSCNYPVLPDIEVFTATDKVKRNQKTILELILARCPDVPSIIEIAARFGVVETPFRKKNDNCILCGLCARVCAEVMGQSAIGFAGRGTAKTVIPPFDRESDRCIACGACASVCPTKCIHVERKDDVTLIEKWGTEREMVHCRVCGAPVGTRSQIEYLAGKFSLDEHVLSTCSRCRSEQYADKVVLEGHM